MFCYIVNGGKVLNGKVAVSGSKNASLPILAACIINGKTIELTNLPQIEDVKTTLDILRILGCKVFTSGNKVQIDSSDISENTIPEEMMRSLRSSVIIAGAMIARFHEVKFSYPGGCDIGSRPIDLHLKAFRKLGIKIDENTSFIECKCDKILNSEIHLDFPSVGATENIILASVLGKHKVKIENAAMEPEIIDLANFLNKMGANINGAGSKIIEIEGVESLNSISYEIMPDRIEAGTLLVAGAMNKGNIAICNSNPEHIKPIISKLEECGCDININDNEIFLKAPQTLKATDIKTMPYPGFPTDLQPIFATMLTIAKGTSIITENIFENRFKYMQELKRMGAKVNFEGKSIVVKGTRKLHGANVESTDLRGGMALVLAGLYAKGYTRIDKVKYILRGYENIDIKLNKLGASILRKEV